MLAVQENPTVTRAGTREWWGLVILMLPVLLVSIDNNVLSFAIPSLSQALAPTGVELLWIVDVYALVLAGLLVPMGSLGDRIGRRRLLMIGSVGFGVFSLVAAFAPSAALLIVARALMAVFGAMLMPATLSLIRNIFTDPSQRRFAVAIWAAGFSGGAALGPIVGGMLLEHFWWGSVFLLSIPVLLPLLIFAPILLPESKDPSPGAVDRLGVVLVMGAMLSVTYGIKEFAHDGAAAGLPFIAVGLVLGFLFVRRQLSREKPMLDVRLFQNPVFSGSIASNLLSLFAMVGFIFFLSQHLQLVVGQTPIEAGLTMLPGLVLTVIAGLAVVPLVKRVRPAIVVAAGLLFNAAGYGLVFVAGESVTLLELVIAFLFLGVGVGAAETISNDLILASVPPSRAGSASAISETAYEIGSVLGTAVLGSILTASYRNGVEVPAGLNSEQTAAAGETLGGAVEAARGLPGEAGSALLHSAQAAFDSGVNITSLIGMLTMVLAAVGAAVLLRRVPAHR
ncbi:MFS transporter [Arthrobacter sp. zg-Y877]|uniref:MFS transporter n=1 Tax=Arthrobacter sp. zg-Y877 TaxID=3049074 RepID=UPI0025A3D385|nr:MFS transporter [Arthrobacter sp. zg-Y877]MDM7991386.1 MFS transporter [Arthrobacter sp. zg-Y877]